MKYDFAITIPNYIRTVTISNTQREKYYEYNGITIKAKGKLLLHKYIAKEYIAQYKLSKIVEPHMLKDEYTLGIFKGKKLIDTLSTFPNTTKGAQIHNYIQSYKVLLIKKATNNKVIANSTQAGKPKLYTINGQDFYSGNLHPLVRVKVMTAIKESFLPHLKTFPVIKRESYPYRVEMLIFDCPKLITDKAIKENTITQFWDVGNRAYPYAKGFLDLICTGKTGKLKTKKPKEYVKYFEPLIPDDNFMYISQDPAGARFIPINHHKNRKLVFVFTKDDGKAVANNKYYKEFHKTK